MDLDASSLTVRVSRAKLPRINNSEAGAGAGREADEIKQRLPDVSRFTTRRFDSRQKSPAGQGPPPDKCVGWGGTGGAGDEIDRDERRCLYDTHGEIRYVSEESWRALDLADLSRE